MPVVVSLTQGEVALIDDEDADRVLAKRWSLKRCRNGKLYAQSNSKHADGQWKPVLLHRFIMNAAPGERLDHRNGDGLDCRRDNLRHATHQQNMANRQKKASTSSLFKGVSFHKDAGKWTAYVGTAPNREYLGLFANETDAARAYDRAAINHFGDFANLNFPEELTA